MKSLLGGQGDFSEGVACPLNFKKRVVRFCSHGIPGGVRFTETERRVVASGRGGGGQCSAGTEFQFRQMGGGGAAGTT